jgi:DNA-binding GntR family transcriptional regulator
LTQAIRISPTKPARVWEDDIYSAIREAILEGRYPPGTRLVESRLATEHGVSRTRIRDGLARLEAELLVAPFGGRGLMVRPLSNQDVEEAYAMRLLLEGYAARQAALNITLDELTMLETINDRMVEVETEGAGRSGEDRREMIVAVAELNNEFHGLIQTASRNSRLRELVRTVVDVPLVFKSFFWYSDSELKEAAEDHRQILAALRHRDPENSEAAIRAHITRGLNTLRRELPIR